MADGVLGTYSKTLSPDRQANLSNEVSLYNRKITKDGKELNKYLEQKDFLNLLIAELKNQDPTQPMKDREFIAQMAQFSSLQQMQTMSKSLEDVSGIMAKTQAYSLLGKNVEIDDGKRIVSGIVQEVSGEKTPQMLVNGQLFDFRTVKRVINEEKGE